MRSRARGCPLLGLPQVSGCACRGCSLESGSLQAPGTWQPLPPMPQDSALRSDRACTHPAPPSLGGSLLSSSFQNHQVTTAAIRQHALCLAASQNPAGALSPFTDKDRGSKRRPSPRSQSEDTAEQGWAPPSLPPSAPRDSPQEG